MSFYSRVYSFSENPVVGGIHIAASPNRDESDGGESPERPQARGRRPARPMSPVNQDGQDNYNQEPMEMD